MCGIAGIVKNAKNSEVPREALESMIHHLHHRGPDDYGYYTDGKAGLAHARLSIIDLTSGKQPIHNMNKGVWVVFNGEIFNYVELRKELENKNFKFYTNTDTEVIVHLYDLYGEDFVDYLNGQFAIALWDKQKEKLILTRDRVGIAPLFYTVQDKDMIFGSEIKSIIPVLKYRPSINLEALDQLFTFWSPVSPNSIFKHITEVSPGEMVVYESGNVRKHKYWDWKFPVDEHYMEGSAAKLAEELKSLLIEATSIRLRSDVPVGAYLSGGLDSSVLVSLIKNFTDTSLQTFSIEFEDKELNEARYQQSLASYLGTTHNSILCKKSDIASNFESAIWHTELPVLRSAPVPMSILSGLVHDSGYKVVLTGEGSDEVLGGYDIFKETKIRQFWAKNRQSNFRATLLKRLYPYLDVSPGRAQMFVQSFFGQGLDQPHLSYFSHIPRWDTTSKIKQFYSDSVKGQLQDSALETFEKTLPASLENWHFFNKAQYIESKSLMGGYLLCSQGDRMLMKNSVEGRFPFLDHRVIEFANSLRPDLKMKVLNEKYLLKQAMKNYIPKDILNRYKQPYRAPDIPSFINNHTQSYVMDLLSTSKIEEYDYFDSFKVNLLMKKIHAGKAIGFKDNMAFMGILSTQMLHSLFIEDTNNMFKQYRH